MRFLTSVIVLGLFACVAMADAGPPAYSGQSDPPAYKADCPACDPCTCGDNCKCPSGTSFDFAALNLPDNTRRGAAVYCIDERGNRVPCNQVASVTSFDQAPASRVVNVGQPYTVAESVTYTQTAVEGRRFQPFRRLFGGRLRGGRLGCCGK